MNVEFKKDCIKKLEDITKEYIETTDEEGNSNKKTITIKIDGQTLLTTYFGETLSNGQIQIPYGDATNDQETLQGYVESLNYITNLLNYETIPIVYTINENQFVSAVIDKNTINKIIMISCIILAIIILYLIIRYKKNGLLSGIALVGFIALLMLIIRITNIALGSGCMMGILLSIIIEIIFLNNLLNVTTRKKANDELIKMLLLEIPLYGITLVSCFASFLPIVSFGTALFWGLIIIMLLNWIMKYVLINNKKLIDEDERNEENEE